MDRTRRQVLGLCALTPVSFAGCLSGGRSSADTSQIGSVVAYNFDQEPHTVHIRVQDSSESVIYDNSVDLPAGDPKDPNGVIIEDFPNNPPEGTLLVQVGESSENEVVTRSLTFEIDCVELNIHIGDYDEGGENASIFTGKCT